MRIESLVQCSIYSENITLTDKSDIDGNNQDFHLIYYKCVNQTNDSLFLCHFPPFFYIESFSFMLNNESWCTCITLTYTCNRNGINVAETMEKLLMKMCSNKQNK